MVGKGDHDLKFWVKLTPLDADFQSIFVRSESAITHNNLSTAITVKEHRCVIMDNEERCCESMCV